MPVYRGGLRLIFSFRNHPTEINNRENAKLQSGHFIDNDDGRGGC